MKTILLFDSRDFTIAIQHIRVKLISTNVLHIRTPLHLTVLLHSETATMVFVNVDCDYFLDEKMSNIELFIKNIQHHISNLKVLSSNTLVRKSLIKRTGATIEEPYTKRVPTVPPEKVVPVEVILQFVSELFEIDVATLQTKTSTHNILIPRQIFFYLARMFTKLSLAEIGAVMCKNEHTVVMYACDAIIKQLKKDRLLQRQFLHLFTLLNTYST